jgi:hypothetical protein
MLILRGLGSQLLSTLGLGGKKEVEDSGGGERLFPLREHYKLRLKCGIGILNHSSCNKILHNSVSKKDDIIYSGSTHIANLLKIKTFLFYVLRFRKLL